MPFSPSALSPIITLLLVNQRQNTCGNGAVYVAARNLTGLPSASTNACILVFFPLREPRGLAFGLRHVERILLGGHLRRPAGLLARLHGDYGVKEFCLAEFCVNPQNS
jgi:hypothetical protein